MAILWDRNLLVLEETGTERWNNLPNVRVGKVLEEYNEGSCLPTKAWILWPLVRSFPQIFLISKNSMSWLNKHMHKSSFTKYLLLCTMYSDIFYSFGVLFPQILIVTSISPHTINTGSLKTTGLVDNRKCLLHPSSWGRCVTSQLNKVTSGENWTEQVHLKAFECKYV